MARLTAAVGLPGAGKTTVVDTFVAHGFERIYFGGFTLEKLKEAGKEISEQNERQMREALRAEHGMAAYAVLAVPKIEAALQKGDVVIDGLYSWEEYLLLIEKFPFLEIIAIYAPPALRYARLKNRPTRPLTAEEAKSRDYAQIEKLHQAGPIAMADYTFNNTGTREELVQMTEGYING